ncbi:hypothetical protein ONZ43_g2493 [Nemania bipapillata]|uniref:Uncharacterized protein n=1 Tax=Nemania bipapillata TaxID=110536 RepID=A0ACC2J0F4_9PEZI|nr:hypothetical protein ONZ43_g2493 [Nemania bipapillata]
MSDPTSSAFAAPEPGQFRLQILSPSINVPQPLFLNLPATTTVRQLKAQIRSHIPSKPPDDAQRLIHRGRLLARDSETMLELFGEELTTRLFISSYAIFPKYTPRPLHLFPSSTQAPTLRLQGTKPLSSTMLNPTLG